MGHSLLSVAMQNHHQKRWSANNMYITRNRIQKLDYRRTWEINFSGPFSLWKRVRNWSCVSQNFQHLLRRSLCRSCSELSAFLEELTVTSCQFLVWDDFNFHVNDNSNANPKQFSEFLFSDDLSSPIQAHWESTLELVAEM